MAMGQNWETLVEHENEQNGPQPHVGDGSFQLRKQNAFSGCLEAGGYLKRLSLSLSLTLELTWTWKTLSLWRNMMRNTVKK